MRANTGPAATHGTTTAPAEREVQVPLAARGMRCRPSASEAVALRGRPNVTANVVFFKLHKVGGTTFASSLAHSLRAAGHLIAERAAQPLATACVDHQGGRDSGKVLAVLATFRRTELLEAAPHSRACMLNRHELAVNHGACRLAVSLPTLTAIVLRDPVGAASGPSRG